MAFGTLSVTDLLATTQQSVAEVGEERIFQTLQDDLAVHNARVIQMRAELAETTTDRQRRYGGNDTMVMEDLGEFGTPDAQKTAAGVTVGFPLRLAGVAIQWTRKWFQNHVASELAAQYTAAKAADIKRIERDIKRAIFTAAPTSTFVDRLVDNVSLTIRPLVNADSQAIPLGPEGDSFNAATHTHYTGTASFVAGDLTALITNVQEHFNTGEVRVYINSAQEATVRAFTGFNAYIDPRLMLGTQANQPGARLDLRNPTNRAIGVFGPAEIWVKPWIPASYLFAYVVGAPPPLVFRVRNAAADALVIAADDEVHPLRAQTMEREFGVSVWTRTNGAVLYTASGTYASPTITA